MRLPKHLTRGGINYAAGQRHIDSFSVMVCRMLIREHVKPRSYFYTKRSSYSLKHVCERLAGCYIGNGDLIAAMILEGYRWKEKRPGNPNAYFAADFRELFRIDRLCQQAGPPVVDPDCVDCLESLKPHTVA